MITSRASSPRPESLRYLAMQMPNSLIIKKNRRKCSLITLWHTTRILEMSSVVMLQSRTEVVQITAVRLVCLPQIPLWEVPMAAHTNTFIDIHRKLRQRRVDSSTLAVKKKLSVSLLNRLSSTKNVNSN